MKTDYREKDSFLRFIYEYVECLECESYGTYYEYDDPMYDVFECPDCQNTYIMDGDIVSNK